MPAAKAPPGRLPRPDRDAPPVQLPVVMQQQQQPPMSHAQALRQVDGYAWLSARCAMLEDRLEMAGQALAQMQERLDMATEGLAQAQETIIALQAQLAEHHATPMPDEEAVA